MLNHKGFDLWADGYDKSVGLSDEANTYPFAGYKRYSLQFSDCHADPKRVCAGHRVWNRRADGEAV